MGIIIIIIGSNYIHTKIRHNDLKPCKAMFNETSLFIPVYSSGSGSQARIFTWCIDNIDNNTFPIIIKYPNPLGGDDTQRSDISKYIEKLQKSNGVDAKYNPKINYAGSHYAYTTYNPNNQWEIILAVFCSTTVATNTIMHL